MSGGLNWNCLAFQWAVTDQLGFVASPLTTLVDDTTSSSSVCGLCREQIWDVIYKVYIVKLEMRTNCFVFIVLGGNAIQVKCVEVKIRNGVHWKWKTMLCNLNALLSPDDFNLHDFFTGLPDCFRMRLFMKGVQKVLIASVNLFPQYFVGTASLTASAISSGVSVLCTHVACAINRISSILKPFELANCAVFWWKCIWNGWAKDIRVK